jgi:protease-4
MKKFRRVAVWGVVGLLLVWWLSGDSEPAIPQDGILVLALEGRYTEAAEPSLISRVLGSPRPTFVGLLSEMRKAERDDRLAGVVLRVRKIDVGWAKAQEIREAIEALSAAGRKTVAYVEHQSFAANIEYFIASAADEIVLAPAARIPVIGLSAEYLFLGGLWDLFGIELEVERIGKYKSFADTFTRSDMSEAHREMANSLLDSIDGQFVAGIAKSRGVSEEFVRNAIDAAAMTPAEMQALSLIDGTGFEDEAVRRIGPGEVVRAADYARVDPTSVGFDPVAKFALVYGSGAVVMGNGTASRSGAPVLASGTVSAALRDAAEDDEIAGIIFRIDSPGGSALASDVIWNATQSSERNGKPLVVSFSDVAASGGYYVAAGADAIVASPATVTGSIGVVVLRPVLRGLFEKLDIGIATLSRGRHADIASSANPLSDGSRERLATEVQSIYDLFVERVAAGRDLSPERVHELGRGRVWTGEQAHASGLVDELGGLRVATRRVKEALGLDPDADVALLPYPKPKPLAEQISEAMNVALASAAPSLPLPLPRLAADAVEWLESIPEGAPALLPPFAFDIR